MKLETPERLLGTHTDRRTLTERTALSAQGQGPRPRMWLQHGPSPGATIGASVGTGKGPTVLYTLCPLAVSLPAPLWLS